MKVVLLFFLYSFFLLSGVYQHAYASGHDARISSYSPAQHVAKAEVAKFGRVNQIFPMIKDNSLNERREDLISVEDEDDDFMSSRKYVLLVRYFFTLAYASVLIYFYNYIKSRLPFCKHLSYASSYKYILQRVLRI